MVKPHLHFKHVPERKTLSTSLIVLLFLPIFLGLSAIQPVSALTVIHSEDFETGAWADYWMDLGSDSDFYISTDSACVNSGSWGAYANLENGPVYKRYGLSSVIEDSENRSFSICLKLSLGSVNTSEPRERADFTLFQVHQQNLTDFSNEVWMNICIDEEWNLRTHVVMGSDVTQYQEYLGAYSSAFSTDEWHEITLVMSKIGNNNTATAYVDDVYNGEVSDFVPDNMDAFVGDIDHYAWFELSNLLCGYMAIDDFRETSDT